MELAFTILLALLVAWMLFKPFLTSASDYQPESTSSYQSEKRERLDRLDSDLELDFAMGKITESDYKQMKSSLDVEFAGVSKKDK